MTDIDQTIDEVKAAVLPFESWERLTGETGVVPGRACGCTATPPGGSGYRKLPGEVKANNSVESDIDFICAKIKRKQFFVCETCTGVFSDVQQGIIAL
jgi:hypothetical protein